MRPSRRTSPNSRLPAPSWVDPITIPNLKTLLTRRVPDPVAADAALKLYLARNPKLALQDARGLSEVA